MPVQIMHSGATIYGTEKVAISNGKQTFLVCGDGQLHISDKNKDSQCTTGYLVFCQQLQEFLLSLEGHIQDENDAQWKKGFEMATSMAITSVKGLRGKVDQESQIGVDMAIEQLEEFKMISERAWGFTPSQPDESDLLEAEKAI